MMKLILSAMAAVLLASTLGACSSTNTGEGQPVPPGSGGRGETPGQHQAEKHG